MRSLGYPAAYDLRGTQRVGPAESPLEGDTARVTVRRGGEEKTLDLTFFKMPKPKGH